MAAAERPVSAPEPLLPFELMDAAEQRTWVVSGCVLLQSYKLWNCIESFGLAGDDASSSSAWLLLKWITLDALLVGFLIPRLRIPKLDWPPLSRAIILAPLIAINWLLFTSAAWSALGSLPTVLFGGLLPDYRMAVDEHRVRFRSLQDPTEHILGRHTVHVLPHASARLAPQLTSYCLPLDDSKASITIPLIFNNTRPHSVQYSLTDPATTDKTMFDVAENQILAKTQPALKPEEQDNWGLPARSSKQKALGDIGKHSHVLQIRQPGLLRLERLISVPPHADIPFSRLDSVLIVPCPTAHLQAPPSKDLCAGSAAEAQLQLTGVPPLALEYLKTSPQSTQPETLKLEGITPPQILAEGQSTSIAVPLEARLDKIGRHSFQLSRVTDHLGNTVSLLEDKKAKRKAATHSWSIDVHGSQTAHLQGCSSRSPLKLLQGGKVQFGVVVEGAEKGEGPFKVTLSQADGSTRTISLDEGKHQQSRLTKMVDVTEPGEYELLAVNSGFCEGTVQAPLTCPVIYQAPPTVNISFTTLDDACAGSIGLKATAELTGEPPFKLHYAVTHKRDRQHERTTTHTKVIQNTHDEIMFQPEQIGAYTWQALRLEDASYKGQQAQNLKSLPDLQAKTTVHPLASAKWVMRKDEDARNCEGKTVQAKVDLTGDAPFALEYQVSYGNKRETKVVSGLKDSSVALDVAVPSKLDKSGGVMTLSLTKITDGRSCQRTLQTDDLVVHVRRTKPTAKIYYSGKDKHSVRVREGQDVSIPLRLTGEGPWTLRYRRTTTGESHERKVKLQSPSSELLVNQQGTYELLSVADRFCDGSVASDKPFMVDYIAKPTLAVKVDEKGAKSSSWLSTQETFKRSPICVNAPDSVELHLTGSPPFTVRYAIVSELNRQEKSLLAVTDTAHLLLSTDQPGRVEYEIHGVSDSVYENPAEGHLFGLAARTQVKAIRIEQQILPLPSGFFTPTARPPKACVNAPFAGKDSGLTLQLVGQPPFELELEASSSGTGEKAHRFSVRDIKTNEWVVQAPDYKLSKAGNHEFRLVSVQDAHGCKAVVDRSAYAKKHDRDDFALVRQQSPRAVVNVLESASIVATSAKQDVCVGDSLDFVLQGSPPFGVTYEFEGKSRTVQVRNTMFSRLAEKAGTFKITGVAHQQTQCQTSVDIARTIHSIPRVRVDSKVEDIREGDQTEIKFSFEGTPPFTFAYTRTHPLRPTEVLEEKTVAGILDYSYTVSASSEGVWQVKFIQDAYCQLS